MFDDVTDVELLRKYTFFQRWFGDDFSINPVSEDDEWLADKIKDEILRRMRTCSG